MCEHCHGSSLRTDTSEYGNKLRKEIETEHIEKQIRLQEIIVIEAAKKLRELIKDDDHWCVENCYKCEARDTFDRAVDRLKDIKNLYV